MSWAFLFLRSPQAAQEGKIKKILAEISPCKDEAAKLRGTTLVRLPLTRQAFFCCGKAAYSIAL